MSYVQPVIDAFLKGANRKMGNTETRGNVLYLFGNKIAWIDLQNYLWIQDCGYCTSTTQRRLNMLPGVWLKRTSDNWYLSKIGMAARSIDDYLLWDGKAIIIRRII